MNILDIIICVVLAIGLFMGFRDGAIKQLGSLLGVIIAIYLAKRYSLTVASMLGIGGDYAQIWGYIIILIVALIAAGLIAKLISSLLAFVGLSSLDKLCGAVLSAGKYVLILAIVFSLIDSFRSTGLAPDIKIINTSKLYAPIASTSKYILPSLEWVGDQIPQTKE